MEQGCWEVPVAGGAILGRPDVQDVQDAQDAKVDV